MNVSPVELLNTAIKEPFMKESVMMANNNIILCLAYSVRHCGIVGHLHKINTYFYTKLDFILYRLKYNFYWVP